MLWNPSWEKPAPMSNGSFIDFLSRQTGTYVYHNQYNCAIAQYLKEQFPEKDVRVNTENYFLDSVPHKLPENWDLVVKSGPCVDAADGMFTGEKNFADAYKLAVERLTVSVEA